MIFFYQARMVRMRVIIHFYSLYRLFLQIKSQQANFAAVRQSPFINKVFGTVEIFDLNMDTSTLLILKNLPPIALLHHRHMDFQSCKKYFALLDLRRRRSF
jgi:hypothetical protein